MSSVLANNSVRLHASVLSKQYPSVPKALLNNRGVRSNSTILSPIQTCYFRNFHTSPLVLAKDPKDLKRDFIPNNKKFDNKPNPNQNQSRPEQRVPPPKTPQQPQRTSPVQAKSTPTNPAQAKSAPVNQKVNVQTIQGENMPRTVIRGPESLADIKSNISKLCDEEIRLLQETEGLTEAVDAEIGLSFLATNKFTLNETEDGLVKLTRALDNHVVVVTFDKFEEPAQEEEARDQDEDEDVEENDEDAEEDIDEDLENEDGKDEELSYKTNLNIEVQFKNKDGSHKGKWILSGFAGKDNRLYINDMGIDKTEPKAVVEDPESEIPQNMVPFETLSDDMQDRLYDFLDEVGVDDQLAHFVKQYLIQAEVKQASNFLEELKNLMKN